tara:strand:+ start:929 stop:1150 length:222 start_codon:yes stop_codon:yes gene_type:complete
MEGRMIHISESIFEATPAPVLMFFKQFGAGLCIIFGLLLLIGPDIEIISSAGALLMCLGLIPDGIREMRTALG